jgi:hypothetical protein
MAEMLGELAEYLAIDLRPRLVGMDYDSSILRTGRMRHRRCSQNQTRHQPPYRAHH